MDIASLRYLTERENFLNSFTTPAEDGEVTGRTLVVFADIQDPNQLAVQYTLTATEFCKRVYDGERKHWYHAYDLIKDVREKTGVNLRVSNKMYPVDMNRVSRYSMHMVILLRKLKIWNRI
ncbi:hypothetical protein bmyco0003_49380 [Bacillus pseudomycoides]|uniref:hypothetical protein n=1 Tax=Bacillus pseudomycoides TaxID=64104 RepID=UPI0001A1558D|nr:hypothetical protein [Bacillus pseudomycoides]EEM08342.1 hypothetical protein bmyco0003_49380 [Bacillus pseudomycoides]